MNFFEDIWKIQNDGNLESKFSGFERIFADFNSGFYDLNSTSKPNPLVAPSYALNCAVYEMKELKNHKNENKDAAFLHSIAHIEYSAIDIALDACYRFRNLPKEYYFDWLEVANDEIRHFKMINELLEKSGYKYGDFGVHNGLFIAMQKTQNSLIDRMAVLPRYMEANGLDANLFMMSKLRADSKKRYLLEVLEVIHAEEIDHVKKGDKWFKFASAKCGIDPNSWIDIVLKHYPNAFNTKRVLDKKHRLLAGFSESEITKISYLQKDK
ncbi:ferritin-like domain-containing protein [Campylobacter hyointestinalis]|uniref:ferritin-like domain-containing protein n=1 Tax=Campylobacter hyointestinalis TaxID=198 RepID=UPI000DCB6397|nr:ferritin-like domain-containing protein [Campylobacter hyointestinalis]RAZ56491.1 DUF455 domain-containing protein [Campylobacter hyointestinalis subsp. lawsonii]RAZ64596.1 DUF455 domain-containing protein [Campylobacter hyointestinalis subsp. lawsonii]